MNALLICKYMERDHLSIAGPIQRKAKGMLKLKFTMPAQNPGWQGAGTERGLLTN